MIWCHLHDPALLAAAQLVLGEGPDLVDGGGGERAQHGLGHLAVQSLLLRLELPAACNSQHLHRFITPSRLSAHSEVHHISHLYDGD